jgi:hypothetical protein
MNIQLGDEYFDGLEKYTKKYTKLYLAERALALYRMCLIEMENGNKIAVVNKEDAKVKDIIGIV